MWAFGPQVQAFIDKATSWGIISDPHLNVLIAQQKTKEEAQAALVNSATYHIEISSVLLNLNMVMWQNTSISPKIV